MSCTFSSASYLHLQTDMRITDPSDHGSGSPSQPEPATASQSSPPPTTASQEAASQKSIWPVTPSDPIVAAYREAEDALFDFIVTKVPSWNTVSVLNVGCSIEAARPTLFIGIRPNTMTAEEKERATGLLREHLDRNNLSRLDVEIEERMIWP